MDFQALEISFRLAIFTSLILLPIGIVIGRFLAWSQRRWTPLLQSLIFLPLVLPPTVMGYYFLTAFSGQAPLGGLWELLFNRTLNFSFEGLLIASVIVNLPFSVQPIQYAFNSIDRDLRDASLTCGLPFWKAFYKIELPLIWQGLAGVFVLTFAHTLGEFGVVLMVGGNLAGETRTLSIAIYDQVQAFNLEAAGQMSLVLLALAFACLLALQVLGQFRQKRHA